MLKGIARRLPQSWRDGYRNRFVNIRWDGDYASWSEAKRNSKGYDAPLILERVVAAARKVKAGKALFERDGVALTKPGPTWPVAEWITLWAKGQGAGLSVLDFGGSLASRYFQHRETWKTLRQIAWRVVEQPAVVAAGRREFNVPELSFFETIEEAEKDGKADVLLMSAVLQYLEDPHAMLRSLLRRGFPVVVLGRAPMISRGRHRLTVQRVPAGLSSMSYPCWQFDRETLLAEFAADYHLALEFHGADGDIGGASYRGFIFLRKAEAPRPGP
jgi:putative methyltransferase (TIGR04325 family)